MRANRIKGRCINSWQYPQTISSIGDITHADLIKLIESGTIEVQVMGTGIS